MMEKPTEPDRIDSDSTLIGQAHSLPMTPENETIETPVIARPKLTLAKFQTERPRAVAQQPSDLGIQRRATGITSTDQAANHAEFQYAQARESSDSSSSSDTEGEDGTDRRSAEGTRHQKHDITSKRNLNRTRQQDSSHRFSIGNQHVKSKGKVSKSDGRLKISVNETANSGYLAKALGTHIQRHLHGLDQGRAAKQQQDRLSRAKDRTQTDEEDTPPRLNIVVMVIGSRGDIQPFLKVGKLLKEKHGHRVRIATHPTFKGFVEKDSNLEFFSVGGDPSELMAFMVKNPGLLPSIDTVLAGEIGKRRDAMYEMFQGFWRACINATDDEKDLHNVKMMGDKFVS